MEISNDKKEKIVSVLNKNGFMVIATNSSLNGSPESAAVAFSYTDSLEIIFGSFSTSRKNSNITQNRFVSCVIGWDNSSKKTIQLEGAAVLIEGDVRKLYEEVHCARNPESIKFQNDKRQQYFKIVPHWIRFSDFSVDPQEVWEIK